MSVLLEDIFELLPGYRTKIGAGPFVPNLQIPQARGLVGWFPAIQAPYVFDPIRGLKVPYLASTVQSACSGGLAVDAATNNRGAMVAAPVALQSLLTVTLMCVFWQKAAPVINGQYFGVTYAGTDASPYQQYSILASGSGLAIFYNNAGTLVVGTESAAVPTNGALHVLVAVITTGRQQLYLDGVSIASNSAAISSINSSGGNVGIGQQTSDVTTRNPGALILDCRLYDRAITDQEARHFSDNWTDLYLPPALLWAKPPVVVAGHPAVKRMGGVQHAHRLGRGVW